MGSGWPALAWPEGGAGRVDDAAAVERAIRGQEQRLAKLEAPQPIDVCCARAPRTKPAALPAQK